MTLDASHFSEILHIPSCLLRLKERRRLSKTALRSPLLYARLGSLTWLLVSEHSKI